MKYSDNSFRNRANVLIECLALPVLIILIWGITCVSKGIWPFGQMLIDIGDMGEECVPIYTHLWDVLHGRKSLFFDWYTGLGNNMSGIVLHDALISPFSLFFLFVKRSAIEYSMSVYILCKLIAIGFSMRFLLKKWFPALSGWMHIAFSLLYVFCAFNMQYYYFSPWLDLVFMFPLVMYCYFLLLHEKKSIPYIICLAITCMMGFQHTYILMLMLLFLTGILPLLSKEKYSSSLLQLLVATLIAVMIAAWILLPAGIQMLQSRRAESDYGLIEIWGSVWIFFTAKWMKLLNMGIPLASFSLYSIKHYKEKFVKFFGFIIIILCAPICLESTNILWHGGLYQGYTMRFAYMLAFWILAAGAYALERGILSGELLEAGRSKERLSNVMGITGVLLLIAATVSQYVVLKSDMTTPYKSHIPAVTMIFIIALTFIGGCGFLLLYKKKKVFEKVFLIMITLQSLTLPMTMIMISGEKETSSFAVCSQAAEQNDGNDYNPLTRIKSMNWGLTQSYPLSMCKNAVSCYLGINSDKQLDGVFHLGYARVGYRMSDYGGTLFSDALLGVSEVISIEDANESIYEYQDVYAGRKRYKSLYGYRQGIRIENPAKDDTGNTDNPFLYQNRIAKEVLGRELFNITMTQDKEISLEIGEKSVLYLYTEQEETLDAVEVTDLNTRETYIMDLPDSGWMNGILELGTWEKASLVIKIVEKEKMERDVSCALLPLQDFTANEPDYFDSYTMNAENASLQIVLEGGAEGDDYLFLPLYHDSGWRCSVNGQKKEIEELGDFFMLIPLQAGTNEITLSFVPIGLLPGIWITIAGILLLIIVCKYHGKKEWPVADRVLWVMDEVVFAGLMTAFYAIPIVFLVIKVINVL